MNFKLRLKQIFIFIRRLFDIFNDKLSILVSVIFKAQKDCDIRLVELFYPVEEWKRGSSV